MTLHFVFFSRVYSNEICFGVQILNYGFKCMTISEQSRAEQSRAEQSSTRSLNSSSAAGLLSLSVRAWLALTSHIACGLCSLSALHKQSSTRSLNSSSTTGLLSLSVRAWLALTWRIACGLCSLSALHKKRRAWANCAFLASCGCGALETEYNFRDGLPSDLTGLLYPVRFGGFLCLLNNNRCKLL